MRLFVAIDLPPVTRAALTRLQGDLRVGRHADADTLHVTLAFLDEQDLPVAEAVHEALSEIDMPEFTLRIRGLARGLSLRASSAAIRWLPCIARCAARRWRPESPCNARGFARM